MLRTKQFAVEGRGPAHVAVRFSAAAPEVFSKKILQQRLPTVSGPRQCQRLTDARLPAVKRLEPNLKPAKQKDLLICPEHITNDALEQRPAARPRFNQNG